MFDFGPKRPVAAFCVFSGQWVMTQAVLTRRQFQKLPQGLHFWCTACRSNHDASGAHLVQPDDAAQDGTPRGAAPDTEVGRGLSSGAI
jgi:hypothetical protein